ncbi:MAG: SRPBCC family protein [Verrucomicrobiota bacterium]
MTNIIDALTTSTADREIIITRTFEAPRELVWDAMTNPKHVGDWWGPRGFSATVEKMDFRVGGVWKHVMVGPDSAKYPNESTFKEIVRPERIVFSKDGHHENGPGAKILATWTFDTLAPQKTKVTLHLVFATADERNFVVKEFGAIEGAKQTLERLGEHLAKSLIQPFVISREFAAPRELVWKAWAEQGCLMQWFGPRGFTMRTARLDFRPGGSFHYSMNTPDGKELWGKFIYREILAPQKIVLVNCFSDETGGVTRHPFSATWPLEMLTTIVFAERGGKTLLTIEWVPLDAAEQERKTFDSGRESMTQGWTGTFQQLDEYLAKAV